MAAVECVDIASVARHPRNRRQGDIGEIAGMIAETGFHGSVAVQRRAAHPDLCLVGWHRTQALGSIAREGYTFEDGTHLTYEELAWQVSLPPKGRVPVEPLTITDELALKKVLADNRATDLAAYDEAGLTADLRALAEFDPDDGLRGTGFTGDDLDERLAFAVRSSRSKPKPITVRTHRRARATTLPEWAIVIACADEEDQRTLLDEFMQRGLPVRTTRV